MIEETYTLITKIPVYIDGEGQVYTDDLWELDLSAHLLYIRDFRLCCPIRRWPDRNDHALNRVAGLRGDQLLPLAEDCGWISVACNIIPNFARVARALQGSAIVHTGGSGWAFPPAYYLLALRMVRRFKWIMVIESSFWMKPADGSATLRQSLSHHLNFNLLRACVRRADARIFTQDWYRRLFLGEDDAASLIAPAVWVNATDVISELAIVATLAERKGPLRLIFPARLIAEKGVATVLASIACLEVLLDRHDAPQATLDIVGSGSLADQCRHFADNHVGRIQVYFRDPVPYGAPFFAMLREYDAILIANRQAEQPRIVFDAFSQGVTCIASHTPGIASIVSDGVTGLLFPIDNAEALAAAIATIASDRALLAAMRMQGLATVRQWTHQAMHQTREVFLQSALGLALSEP